MPKILHIINGDATLPGFQHTGLDGDILVWREVLSEGPLSENISSASFWEKRKQFITQTFNANADEYQHKVIDQLGQLNEPYDEFNLWFDFDLHCQANMLGVLQLLQQKTDMSAPTIYLICPDGFEGHENFHGMGELNGRELDYLYDNIRVQLTEYDLILAAAAWKAFVKKDAAQLQQFLDDNIFWANLPLLKPALEAEVKTLRINTDGLNYIEQKLLDIYNSGITTRANIYTAFWADEAIYGMGDTQLDIYLNILKRAKLINIYGED